MGPETAPLPLSPISPYHFAFFRMVMGCYLLAHFISLIPYAAEVWGPSGMIPDPRLNMTAGILPNPLAWLNSDGFGTGFIITLALLSVAFIIGWQRPMVSLLLWFGWACLLDRNNLIANPGIPYVGWLLLVCAVAPKGEPLSVSKRRSDAPWALPRVLYIGAWILMAAGYTISGIDKWLAPSWRDGSAIVHLLENPLARDTSLRTWILGWPDALHRIMTWCILAMEVLFLPLALFQRTRLFAWLGMVSMHLGILCIVDFADLTVGMLMIHLFTLDERWLRASRTNNAVVFFDGICGLCNNFIDLLMQEDRGRVLYFSPLQGSTAQERIAEHLALPVETVIYQRNGRTFTKSSAALRILSDIGGVWKVMTILLVIPAFMRNAVYDLVARNRYRWFGKKESCRMPTPEERARFLP